MDVGIVFLLAGIFILAAVGFRWAWFMNHWKVRGTFEKFGRRGAVVIYVASGLCFVIIGILALSGVIRFE
jgi:hypothetical protein